MRTDSFSVAGFIKGVLVLLQHVTQTAMMIYQKGNLTDIPKTSVLLKTRLHVYCLMVLRCESLTYYRATFPRLNHPPLPCPEAKSTHHYLTGFQNVDALQFYFYRVLLKNVSCLNVMKFYFLLILNKLWGKEEQLLQQL